ncbi:MAG: RNA polymerase [Tombusviridae sp.]|nr:MAG: RNA polymerase [Tombusviridae sp.]
MRSQEIRLSRLPIRSRYGYRRAASYALAIGTGRSGMEMLARALITEVDSTPNLPVERIDPPSVAPVKPSIPVQIKNETPAITGVPFVAPPDQPFLRRCFTPVPPQVVFKRLKESGKLFDLLTPQKRGDITDEYVTGAIKRNLTSKPRYPYKSKAKNSKMGEIPAEISNKPMFVQDPYAVDRPAHNLWLKFRRMIGCLKAKTVTSYASDVDLVYYLKLHAALHPRTPALYQSLKMKAIRFMADFSMELTTMRDYYRVIMSSVAEAMAIDQVENDVLDRLEEDGKQKRMHEFFQKRFTSLRGHAAGPYVIDSICMRGTPLKPLSASRAKIRVNRSHDICNNPPSQLNIINPTIGYQVGVHKTCSCNELVALHNRHLIDRQINFDLEYWKSQARMITSGWLFQDIERATLWSCVMAYSGGKRRVYAAAYRELLLTGQRATDTNITMFVKQDKYALCEVEEKMPRAIQYRSPRYNLQLASYLRPFEHVFYQMEGRGPSRTRVITKHLNKRQIATLFLEKAACFSCPIFISADHSKFDSTVNTSHLKMEHAVYDKCFKSKHLKKLLYHQLSNRGYTRSGIRYTIKGTRMSGDYNTGLGNSLINRVVLESWLYKIKHEIMLDGDDSVIIVEAHDLHLLKMDHFEKMGFITKMEFTEEITEVQYCQTRLVLGSHVTMCRNPWRALSNMAVTPKKYHPSVYRDWFSGVAECEASSNYGMPIYTSLMKVVGKRVVKDEEYHRKMQNEVVSVSDTVNRVGFENTFGISIKLQLAIEERVSMYTGYNFKKLHKYKINNNNKNIYKTATNNDYDTQQQQETQRSIESTCCKFHSLDATTTPWWGTNGPGSLGHNPDAQCPAGWGFI